ncbi:SCAN domain-containing protein 1 [Perognathus longimembris pacificus]|uniref:SCAN domain-containing protein 1 n=1 Tax=Perognathus longimembris pacificus TaxID=214514 RepID=UPI0020185116|nr:SCAN domain-containing protein 1 [Perognathus longimembris pacificus]
MAAPENSAATPSLLAEEPGPTSDAELSSAGSSSSSAAQALPGPGAAALEVQKPVAAEAVAAGELPVGPGPAVPAAPADGEARSPPRPGGSRPGPETFRQRFRQFRYQDAAGPREAFRQLRELSRQWLRPDIRTKEQIVEMLVQEQLMAILPELARARRLRRRPDVRLTG